MQDAVAAAGTLLSPNALLLRATEKGCIYAWIDHGGRAQIRDEVHSDTAGHGYDGIILTFPVVQAVYIFFVALSNEGSFLYFDCAAVFFSAKTDERGK
jgi:hypothetical protein